MRPFAHAGAAIGAISLAALVSAGGCDRAREASAMETPVADPPPAAAVAEERAHVTAVTGEPVVRTLALQSHLMVERNVGVTVRRDGIVEEIRVDRGARVREDQVLAVLERGDLLVSERAALLEYETEQAAHDRARKLRDQKIIADEEFEQSRLRLHAAEESLDRIRYDLSKCFIRAPFDGVVTGRFVEKGQFVRQDDRTPVFQVTALGPLLARVYVPEWAVVGLRAGQRARVRPQVMSAAGRSDPEIPARIKWINHVVDAPSASAELIVEVPDGAAEGLRPGLSVEVMIRVALSSGNGNVTLPRSAIPSARPEAGASIRLRILGDDGAAQERPVVLGAVGDDRVEIREGLRPGEKVLTDAVPE